MFIVVHIRERPSTNQPWLREEDFRYWNDRRSVLQQRGALQFEDTSERLTSRVRIEIWRDRAQFELFRDDICGRVIDSIVRHEESLRGVVHRTLLSDSEG